MIKFLLKCVLLIGIFGFDIQAKIPKVHFKTSKYAFSELSIKSRTTPKSSSILNIDTLVSKSSTISKTYKKFGLSVEVGKPEPDGIKYSSNFRGLMLNSIIGFGISANYRYVSKKMPFHINYKLGHQFQIYNGDTRQLLISSIGMSKKDFENGKTYINYFQLSSIANYILHFQNLDIHFGIGPSFAYLYNEKKLVESVPFPQDNNSFYFSPIYNVGIEKNNFQISVQYQLYNSPILGSIDMLSLTSIYYFK